MGKSDKYLFCGSFCGENIVELKVEGQIAKFNIAGNIEFEGKSYSALKPTETTDFMDEDDLAVLEDVFNDGKTVKFKFIENKDIQMYITSMFFQSLYNDEDDE